MRARAITFLVASAVVLAGGERARADEDDDDDRYRPNPRRYFTVDPGTSYLFWDGRYDVREPGETQLDGYQHSGYRWSAIRMTLSTPRAYLVWDWPLLARAIGAVISLKSEGSGNANSFLFTHNRATPDAGNSDRQGDAHVQDRGGGFYGHWELARMWGVGPARLGLGGRLDWVVYRLSAGPFEASRPNQGGSGPLIGPQIVLKVPVGDRASVVGTAWLAYVALLPNLENEERSAKGSQLGVSIDATWFLWKRLAAYASVGLESTDFKSSLEALPGEEGEVHATARRLRVGFVIDITGFRWKKGR
jgi:hypothetical protein